MDVNTEPLTGPLEIERNSFKLHSACFATHAAIEAAQRIRSQRGFRPERIQEIRVRVAPDLVRIASVAAPRDSAEARFSISHCAAVTLLRGEMPVPTEDDSDLRDPAITSLRELTRVEPDETLKDLTSGISVTDRDGLRFEETVVDPVGSHNNPVSSERLDVKFRRLIEPLAGPSETARLLEGVRSLPTLSDVRDLPILHFTHPSAL